MVGHMSPVGIQHHHEQKQMPSSKPKLSLSSFLNIYVVLITV